jgi:hypothetical protein
VLSGRYIPVFQKNLLPSSYSTLKMEAAILFSVLVAELQNIFQHLLETSIFIQNLPVPNVLIMCVLTCTGEVCGSYPSKGLKMEVKCSLKKVKQSHYRPGHDLRVPGG